MVTHTRVTPRMLVRNVSGPFRHDSYLFILRVEDRLTGVVFRTLHQTALAHADIIHLYSNSSLKVASG